MADRATTETKRPPRSALKENIASDSDMQRFFTLIKQQEKEYEALLADLRAQRESGKSVLDKIYTDAADALKSRGISKRILRELYEESRRKPEEIKDHYANKLWAMKVCGMPIGTQADLFEAPAQDASANQAPDPAEGDEAMRRIYNKGRAAHAENAPVDANPYDPETLAGAEWARGRADAQTETVMAMGPKGKGGRKPTLVQ